MEMATSALFHLAEVLVLYWSTRRVERPGGEVAS